MNALTIGLVFATAGLATLLGELRRKQRLALYWQRHCMGFRWRRRFADSSSVQIREFLSLFCEAFGFWPKRRTLFSPDDRVMDIYRTVYPAGSAIDDMELETFARSLEKRYSVEVLSFWREDITLGELYGRVAQ